MEGRSVGLAEDGPRDEKPRSDRAASVGGSVNPLLRVRNLEVDYATQGGNVRAVDGVDLDVSPGQFLGIVGESGCGKSTLLYAISRLLPESAAIAGGEVSFRGVNLVMLRERRLRHMRWRDFSVVMQSAMNALNPVMTIGAQLKDAIGAHQRMPRKQASDRAAEVLRLVGIDPVHLKSYPHQLSGGMRQRAMIAMALVFTPDLILMDEPTSALDVVAQRSLMRSIKALQEQLRFAMVFVTHDMALVGRYADQIAVMYAAQLVERGAAAEIFRTPKHPYTRGLLRAYPSIHGPREALQGIPGRPPDLRLRMTGCRFAPRCPDVMAKCREAAPALVERDERVTRCFLYDDASEDSEMEIAAGAGR